MRALRGGWGLAVVVLLTACATTSREQALDEAAGEHVYVTDPRIVWAQARALLREQGYEVREADRGYELVTPWLGSSDSYDLAMLKRRYRVLGGVRPDGGFVVRAFRITHTTVGLTEPHPSHQSTVARGNGESGPATGYSYQNPGEPLASVRPRSERDLAFEWALLQRVEPREAERIAAQGGARPRSRWDLMMARRHAAVPAPDAGK